MDLLRLLAATLSQRLIDYNRERIHLSQFFSVAGHRRAARATPTTSAATSPRAPKRWAFSSPTSTASPRSASRCWSGPSASASSSTTGARRRCDILHKHGGVFDKMVGDCVIGLFGPPFFKSSRAERAAEATPRGGRDSALHPREDERPPRDFAPLGAAQDAGPRRGHRRQPGAHASAGCSGPTGSYTAFSTGMNQTARLQSLGSFRETLVMDSVKDVLDALPRPRHSRAEVRAAHRDAGEERRPPAAALQAAVMGRRRRRVEALEGPRRAKRTCPRAEPSQ